MSASCSSRSRWCTPLPSGNTASNPWPASSCTGTNCVEPAPRGMNYRHGFHAGNAADVFKHVVLVWLLRTLTAKEKPLLYFETHAGAGRYDLTRYDPDGKGEWREGIARLWAETAAPEAV